MSNQQILIIEPDVQERNYFLNEFNMHKLNHTIAFAANERDALGILDFNKKASLSNDFPSIILLSISDAGLDFVKKLRSDFRFRTVKIYFMTRKESHPQPERHILFENKISGLIVKPLKFKAIDSQSYLDSFSLYLDLIRIQKSA